MSESESTLACALVVSRAAADRAASRLAAEGISATIGPPDSRHRGLPPDEWEIRVPASQAARARALLSAGESAAAGEPDPPR